MNPYWETCYPPSMPPDLDDEDYEPSPGEGFGRYQPEQYD